METFECRPITKPDLSNGDAKLKNGASQIAVRSLSLLLAAACLLWVLHDIDLGILLKSLAAIDWRWVAAAIIFDVMSYICQGLRWRLLLRPVGEVSTLRSTQAIYAGLFTSEILPMRFGEIVRAYLMSRWTKATISSIAPSMVVERLFDGVWMAAAIGAAALLFPLPKNLLKAGEVLGIAVLSGTAIFLYIVFRKRAYARDGRAENRDGELKIVRLVKTFAAKLTSGIREIGFSRSFYVAFAASLLLLVFQALAFWLIMPAFGLKISIWAGMAVFLIVHLGTAVPNAPANVGTYQFFCVLGLTLFGIDKTQAAGFSIAVFILLTIPLWALGFLAFSSSGASILTIKREVGSQKSEVGSAE